MKKTFSKDFFYFKEFALRHDRSAMKVGTDGVLLGAWTPVENNARILDVGTGCGVVALMLAQRNKDASIVGVELDPGTCLDAMENVNQSPWPNRVEIIQKSIQDYAAQSGHMYSDIVSNPPFYSGGTFSESQEKVAVRHTTKLSHGDLLRSVRTLLDEQGAFSVILPHIEGLRFVEIAESYRLYLRTKVVVYSKNKETIRLLMQFKKERGEVTNGTLNIYSADNQSYSVDYIQLTKDFYLKMP